MTQQDKNFIQVDIIDVHRHLYSGSCERIVAPSIDGEVCIMYQHTPLLVKLVPGEIRIRTDTEAQISFYVSGGFLETVDSKVSVLADYMLRSDEIDREAALRSKQEAEDVLSDRRLSRERLDEAELLLLKAVAQLKVVEHVNINRLYTPLQ